MSETQPKLLRIAYSKDIVHITVDYICVARFNANGHYEIRSVDPWIVLRVKSIRQWRDFLKHLERYNAEVASYVNKTWFEKRSTDQQQSSHSEHLINR